MIVLSKEKEYALEIDDAMCFYNETLPPMDKEDEEFEKDFLKQIKDTIK